MNNSGLHFAQISEVRGFADTEPRIAGDPADPRNRRISIIVVNDFSGLNYIDKNVVLKEEDIANHDSKSDDQSEPSNSDEADRNTNDSARVATAPPE